MAGRPDEKSCSNPRGLQSLTILRIENHFETACTSEKAQLSSSAVPTASGSGGRDGRSERCYSTTKSVRLCRHWINREERYCTSCVQPARRDQNPLQPARVDALLEASGIRSVAAIDRQTLRRGRTRGIAGGRVIHDGASEVTMLRFQTHWILRYVIYQSI